MKMVMAVVPRDEAEKMLSALIGAGYTATFTESRGGMLRQAQYTLFIGVEARNLPRVLDIIQESCHSDVRVEHADGDAVAPLSHGLGPSAARVGGAVVFVWDLDRFATY